MLLLGRELQAQHEGEARYSICQCETAAVMEIRRAVIEAAQAGGVEAPPPRLGPVIRGEVERPGRVAMHMAV